MTSKQENPHTEQGRASMYIENPLLLQNFRSYTAQSGCFLWKETTCEFASSPYRKEMN
jgi:hypothetical protein